MWTTPVNRYRLKREAKELFENIGEDLMTFYRLVPSGQERANWASEIGA